MFSRTMNEIIDFCEPNIGLQNDVTFQKYFSDHIIQIFTSAKLLKLIIKWQFPFALGQLTKAKTTYNTYAFDTKSEIAILLSNVKDLVQ